MTRSTLLMGVSEVAMNKGKFWPGWGLMAGILVVGIYLGWLGTTIGNAFLTVCGLVQ